MMFPRFCLSCIEMRFIARLRGLCIFLGTPKFSTISISNPRDRRARWSGAPISAPSGTRRTRRRSSGAPSVSLPGCRCLAAV